MIFSFHHLRIDYPSGNKWEIQPFRFHDLKKNLFTWQREMEKGGGWNALFWYNHDQPRIVSRIGDEGKYRVKSAKMLATTIHGLEGTPYIYQGEEIGMTNVRFPLEDYKDVETINMVKEKQEAGWSMDKIMQGIYAKGRDNARTPMQWSSQEYGGFSDHSPWIKVNPNYQEINVEEARAEEDSIFHFYQKLIRLRKEQEIISTGDFTLLFEQDRDIFAYKREAGNERLTVIANFTGQKVTKDLGREITLGEGEILLSNYGRDHVEEHISLKPYECFMYYEKTEN